jgi:hypothetical protein
MEHISGLVYRGEDFWQQVETYPDIDELSELSGFDMLDTLYGHDPQKLATNSALALVLLLDETKQSTNLGADTPIRDQKSQEFLDSLITTLVAEERRSGYAHLFDVISVNLGGSAEFAKTTMLDFLDAKQRLIYSSDHKTTDEQISLTEQLHNFIYPIQRAVVQFLEEDIGHSELSGQADDVLLWEYHVRVLGRI